jgi:hypothetical protein
MSDKPKLMERLKNSKFAEFMRDKVKPVAGDIVELVGDVTGVEALEKVGQILNKGKEQREELRALDAEFQKYKLQWQLEMESIKMETGLEELRLEVEDRSNARSREVEFMKASGGKRDWLMGVVVITGLLMTVGVVACLVFIRIPEENQRLADMTFGTVLGIGTSIFAYYVGSSRSSRHKDETISRAINGQG